jgi:SAM-dependent MidA family methyltransferase
VALSEWPAELTSALPDGFTTEVGLAAAKWWRAAARALRSGRLLAIDYGLAADGYFTPERARGTLRAYQRHHASDDLLARPGEQDLTAHVNFTAVRRAGESEGLRTDVFQTQEQFLAGMLREIEREPDSFGEWTSKESRQFQTLAHPEHLGRPFRVLVQSR